jgi:hypothetical protein
MSCGSRSRSSPSPPRGESEFIVTRRKPEANASWMWWYFNLVFRIGVVFLLIGLGTWFSAPWLFQSCEHALRPPARSYEWWVPSTIGFGSGLDPFGETNILNAIRARDEDVFIWLGNEVPGSIGDMAGSATGLMPNTGTTLAQVSSSASSTTPVADMVSTSSPSILRWAYNRLSCNKDFQYMAASRLVQLATWSDKEYGGMTVAERYVGKYVARQLFMRFWQRVNGDDGDSDGDSMREPEKDANRAAKHGVQRVMRFRNGTHSVNIVVLDLQWERSNFRACASDTAGQDVCARMHLSLSTCGSITGFKYCPDPSGHIMSPEQWGMLQDALDDHANVTVIASSMQVLRSFSSQAAWNLYPVELARLLAMVGDRSDVVFVSGGPMYGEISRRGKVLDITASGMSNALTADKNVFRVGTALVGRNFGELDLWQREARLLDASGDVFGTATWPSGD